MPLSMRLILFVGITIGGSVVAMAAGKPLQVAVKVNQQQAYVNEQILVTREIRFQPTVFNVTGPDLKVTGADVTTVSASATTIRTATGPIKVKRTVYALFARKPGTVRVLAQKFLGNLPGQPGGTATRVGQRGIPQVKALSRAHSINVIAPAPHTQTWLSASDISVNTQWVNLNQASKADGNQWMVGQPRTRRVNIVATHQQAAAIVPLPQSPSEGLRFYTEPAQLNDAISPNGITGTRVQATIVMPASAGMHTIPGQTLHWFNTTTRQWDLTTIPPETIQVISNPATNRASFWQNGWMLLSAGLATCCIWLGISNRRLRSASEAQFDAPERSETEPQAWRALARQLRYKATNASLRAAMLTWAQARWPALKITRLDQILNQSKSTLSETQFAELGSAIRSIDEQLFSANQDSTKPLQFDELATALIALRRHQPKRQRNRTRAGRELSALYKTGS